MSTTATGPHKQTLSRARSTSIRLVALPLLSAAGTGVSGYLTYVRLAHAVPLCSTIRGCETVNSSPYAAVGDVPVALLGLVLYIVTLSLSFIALRGPVSRQPWSLLGVFGLSLSGALYSGYLTYVELFVLDALCQWCLTSAAIVTALCGISAWTLVRPPGAALPG